MNNSKLKADIIIPDKECLLCRKNSPGENLLIDGSTYHQNCYDYFISRIREIEAQLEEYKSIMLGKNSAMLEAKKSLRKSKGVFNSIKASLGMSHLEESTCWHGIKLIENEIEEIMGRISQWEKERNIKKRKIKSLYDYWPTYPPDWEERTQKIKEKRNTCEVCKETWKLHVHHKIKLSNGGNHTENNLVLLCESCHGEIHHKDFSDEEFEFNEKISSLSKKLNLINKAISQDKKINFRYTKYNGEKSRRTIKPEKLKRVGTSLCIRGFCYLRDEYRIFAIRRMKNIKFIINNM